MIRIIAIVAILVASPAYAQQWDQVNGSMQVKSGPSAPLVIIDQTASGQKILSLRANGTEVCFASSSALTCAGSFTFASPTITADTVTFSIASPDTSLTRGSAGVLNLNGALAHTGANGQVLTNVQALTELTTIAAAVTTDTTIQMPANSVVLGVSVRTTVTIPTAATYTVGDSGSAARFSTAAVGATAGATDPGTKAGAYYNASALSIRITPNATPAANTGRVRVTIYYYTITPPTS